ncbi:NACHT, LRR and PYD domains-containing protein 3-like isoform X2 [Megalobrama amblycephala]|uniref:NACHT, LRR and PYD domains-containing protein 3-like isoform X2 n=1 Tax=Megalobrama amblycephala TaxID=75352 RepID=UPI002013DC2C|nr:NACHT, LRR and PYD domains-containing protein 3-like isoform X2 [Megalobrama amblycephala]
MNAEDTDYHTCDGEKSVQRERSHSPVSVLSMKSDKSMKIPIQLKNGDSLFKQRSLERSAAPSVLSMKSDKSMKIPIQFKNGDSLFDQSSEERSHSPDPSVWSLKSDKSMKIPIQLKDGDIINDRSSEERSHSSKPSVLSLKSDKLMKIPVQLKHGYSLFDQSSLEISNSSDPSATQKTIHWRDETNLPHQRHDAPHTEIHQKLKSDMKMKHRYIFEGLAKQGNPTLLNEIYTDLYITEGGNGEISNEHEIKRIEKTLKTAAGATIPIKCNDIFRPLPGQDKPIRTVLTKGVAGIGKTVSVQKFILDWAEGKENQDVQLIFPLPFRELNLMKDKRISLVGLLQTFFTRETSLHLIQNSSVVFIFDGLDECRLPLNFHSNETLQDATKETSLDVLLTNLIVGNLLPSALIWITSRPAAADFVPSECVHRVTEVRGFNEPQKEEYFRKRISDPSLANTIISHLKSSRSLYIMCHIPVFCWISAAVLEKMLSEAESGEIPKTLTQMYTHFLILQTNIKHEKDYEKNVTDEDMILKLGKVAFQQLVKGNVIFYEKDLRECGIDVTEASVYSGLCTQIFREEFGWYQGKVFCFVHLSIQEHLAALYVHLSFHNSGKNVLVEGVAKESEINVTVPIILKCAFDKTIESKNGHLDLFLRFLMGLSMESNQGLLERYFKKRTIIPQDITEITEYLKEKIKIGCSETSLLVFHCLNELNDQSLINEIQKYITSGKVEDIQSEELGFALTFILMISDEKFDEFELRKYGRSDLFFTWLEPVIKLSTKAWLRDCNITEIACVTLTKILSSQSNVRELDLSHNNLQDSGVEILSVGLKKSQSAQPIMEEWFKSRPKVPNQHLLFDNFISVTAGLQDTECRLESLNLENCGVTETGCGSLSTALSSNPSHLRVLDLSWNNIGNSGVKQLCASLENVQCALEILKLNKCGMTEESCTALASALSSKTSSLTDLDLSINDLQDSGVKKLCAGLQNPHCKLEKLRLSNCNVTHEGVMVLTETLKSNPSHLKELDLLENDLVESDLNVLSMILEKSSLKQKKQH